MSSAGAYFEPQGDRFYPTDLTRGPWDPALMHGGPPAALLARAFEALLGDEMQVARMTVEFVRPLVRGAYSVRTETVRPGRKIRIVSGLLSIDGTEIVRGTALAIRTKPLDLDGAAWPAPILPIAPAAAEPWAMPFFAVDVGYHTSMDVRMAAGRFGTGAVAVWMRMRGALVPGETPSGLQRVMAAADSGNGASVALDMARYTFMNPDLTVCLHRLPAGEWICLDAVTRPQPTGIGLAECGLYDENGPIGRSAQTLILDER